MALYARALRDSADAAAFVRGGVMGNGRFNVAVSFDERRGYVGTHPGLDRP